MIPKLATVLIPIIFSLVWTINSTKPLDINGNTSVHQVLVSLGDTTNFAYPDTINPKASATYGKDLFHFGIISSKGVKRLGKQSKHFVCTSCHNVVREDPDLSIYDPQARLNYVNEKGLPFLPGTTLYGAVNRTSFYNGDYLKKYGDLVKPARNNIREAIQLCAVECSQGRKLEEWELESVLAYLWTIDLKMADLHLTDDDYQIIQASINTKKNQLTAIEKIKESYLSGAPATFVEPPKDRKKGYDLVGNPNNGALIYDSACKYCHENTRYSQFELDDSPFSFRFMKKHTPRYTRYSIYQVIRYGTQPMNGKRAYMPNFTLEKMSHQQVEDLRAYLEWKASE